MRGATTREVIPVRVVSPDEIKKGNAARQCCGCHTVARRGLVRVAMRRPVDEAAYRMPIRLETAASTCAFSVPVMFESSSMWMMAATVSCCL